MTAREAQWHLCAGGLTAHALSESRLTIISGDTQEEDAACRDDQGTFARFNCTWVDGGQVMQACNVVVADSGCSRIQGDQETVNLDP